MAVPTIVSVTPSSGPTGGRTVVEIVGTNFRLPPAPPAVGITPTTVDPIVKVTFGGAEAENVQVISATRLQCNAPRSPIDPNTKTTGAGGAVAVVVTNLDDDGVAISGETVTRASGYTFVLPLFTTASVFTQVVRQLLLEMQRQITPNTDIARQVDFDSVTGDSAHLVEFAKLPAIVLVGPQMVANPYQRERGVLLTTTNEVTGQVTYKSITRAFDLVFDVHGIAQNVVERMNLMGLFANFVDRNPYLYVPADPALPNGDKVIYEFDFMPGGAPSGIARSVNQNVLVFVAKVKIIGVDLEGLEQFANDSVVKYGATVDAVVIDLQKIADS